MDLRKTALTSHRLSLTAFAPDDAAEVFAAVTPTLTRFMAFEPSPSLAAFADIWKAWLPQMAAGTELFLVLRRKPSGEFLGIAGLHTVDNPEPEAGIWIKESAHRLGYGREAVATAIAWAGRELGKQAFLYPVVEANGRSRRLAESLGGVVVGTRRLRIGAIEYPEVVYRIPSGIDRSWEGWFPVLLLAFDPGRLTHGLPTFLTPRKCSCIVPAVGGPCAGSIFDIVDQSHSNVALISGWARRSLIPLHPPRRTRPDRPDPPLGMGFFRRR